MKDLTGMNSFHFQVFLWQVLCWNCHLPSWQVPQFADPRPQPSSTWAFRLPVTSQMATLVSSDIITTAVNQWPSSFLNTFSCMTFDIRCFSKQISTDTRMTAAVVASLANLIWQGSSSWAIRGSDRNLPRSCYLQPCFWVYNKNFELIRLLI